MTNLAGFLEAVYQEAEQVLIDQPLDPLQRDGIRSVLAGYRQRALAQASGDPLALYYWVTRTWDRPLDAQGLRLATFCLFYLLAADVLDDVQDEDLSGKPLEAVGPALALNTGVTALFLGLDRLRQVSEDEADPDRRWAYFRLFNRTSLRAVHGQHLDLMGAAGAASPAEVLAMQAAKTSSLAMIAECAAIASGCSPTVLAGYREASERFVQLVQIVDDLRDLLGKPLSPDLRTGRRTYPIALFYDMATPGQVTRFTQLLAELPSSMGALLSLLEASGTIQRTAETIEGLREGFHQAIASLDAPSPSHRTWLYVADTMAGAIYPPPILEVSRALIQPDGEWHRHVHRMAVQLRADLAPFGPPGVPALLPWHLPQWMFDPGRNAIFYPDLEGQAEEILPPQAQLMGIADPRKVREVLSAQAPLVMAHEFFHYWRSEGGTMIPDFWYEEWAAMLLAVAYAQAFHPELLRAATCLADDILARWPRGITPAGKRLLERLCTLDLEPAETSSGYGFPLDVMALIQLEVTRWLSEHDLSLDHAGRHLLRTQRHAA